MAFEHCAEEIAKAVGRELDPKERDDLGKKIIHIVERLQKKQTGADLHLEVLKATKELSSELTRKALVEKRNTALNASRTAINADYVYNTWKTQPQEGIKAQFEMSFANREGARTGVSNEITSLKHNYIQGLVSKLAKDDLLKIAGSKELDKEIWAAMWELGQKSPDPKVLEALPKEAVQIAQHFGDHTEMARVNANEAGADISKHAGYTIKQSHDSVKISKAGGIDIPTGSEKHFEAWKGFIDNKMDWAKTLQDVPPTEVDKVLRSMFEQFSNGYHMTFGEGGKANGLSGVGNIGKKMSHERVLHFKDAASEFEYHKKFGSGDSLMEGVLTGLDRSARDTAIMRKFGPNAEANLRSMVGNVMEKFTAENKGDLAKATQKEFEKQMKTMWPVITGEINVPGNHMFAQVSGMVRGMEQLSKLGAAVLNGFGDIPGYASTMNYMGKRSAGGMFDGVLEGFKSSFGNMTTKYGPEHQQLASELGIMIDNVIGSITNRHSSDLDVPGRLSQGLKTFFKYTGLTRWQDGERFGSVSATAHRHAFFSNLEFGKLEKGLQEFFGQHGIKSNDWDVIRKAEQFTDSSGRSYLTPERIKDVPDSVIGQALEAKGRKVTKGNITSYKNELTTSYRRMFNDVANMATSEPTMANRAVMLQGTQPGTPMGEVARHFGLFKSFSVSTIQKHTARELYGYNADKVSFARAMADIFSGKNNQGAAGLAQLMVYGTILGYASMSSKQIAKGKMPRLPEGNTPSELAGSTLKIMTASMLQGGAMGIYGDFLFGEKSRLGQDSLTTFLGPTWGTATETKQLFDTVKSGDLPKGSQVMDYTLNHTPGLSSAYNMFYSKAALDYLFVYRLKEYMHPGYLKRMENKVKSDTGQEYFIPPSSVVPRGGF